MGGDDADDDASDNCDGDDVVGDVGDAEGDTKHAS